jgi:divalent metal cation (Fe/Co/Zn/Cd) transporter
MKVAKERKSSVLASNAIHHRVDSLTSIVALLAIGGAHVFNGAAWLDPVGGLLVSIMVIQAGLANTVAAAFELVDVGIDEEVKASIRKAASQALSGKTSSSSVATPTAFGETEIQDVRGTKAGQNYLVEVEVSAPSTWTLQQLREVEVAIRSRVGLMVRGVRRLRVKFVIKEHKEVDFTDEFIGEDLRASTSPEPEAEDAHDHGHNHSNDDDKSSGIRKRH